MIFATCPEEDCGQIAEVVDNYLQESTNGPIEMTRTLCLQGHRVDTWKEAALP